MGALVKSSGNALAAYGGVNPWAEAARDVELGAYLKFNGNTGEITFGSDDTALPAGSQIVVDMNQFALGWMCWVNSEPKEEILVPVTEGKPPMEHELTDHGPYDDDDDGWRAAASFPAVILEYGEDANHEAVGQKLLFKTSTRGAVNNTKRLSGAYGKQFMQHMGELPVVEVSAESYMPKEKKHGKKWSIIFKIVGWISEDELAGIVQGEADADGDYEAEPAPAVVAKPAARRAAPAVDEPEEAPAPAPRRRAAAPAPEPEEEEEAPAPAPRRRAAAPEPAPEPEEAEEEVVPTPRGRSPGRGAPPANARVRRFG